MLLTICMFMMTLNVAIGKYKDHEVREPLLLTNVSEYQTVIECIYPGDISLAFLSFKTNDKNILVDCMFAAPTCVILNDTYKDNFRTLFTGRGGILIIKELNEYTYGNYSCYEMYNSSNGAVSTIEESSLDVKYCKDCILYKNALIVCCVIITAMFLGGVMLCIIPKLKRTLMWKSTSQKETDIPLDESPSCQEVLIDSAVGMNGNGRHKERGNRRYFHHTSTRRRGRRSPQNSVHK
ncbi:uncharacterized protein LOC127870491 isoform X1 [Dreissena polymorpha]|uniref:Uncharacterized protein n=2 Tax=Dreissena polymorpha TaxID=45954 RepID=A0A9D4MGR8_DREPO|nr:uncharacterized protein LOC127870491 isoform X1 [Dreissena polymorpha]XP_052269035.1 uncharacterized protein LOC127870491 isoform X1 [Dreissena polymorpha]KAH3875916.1 hypothetical protein DPMN_039198 [Dreissena polymorpha]